MCNSKLMDIIADFSAGICPTRCEAMTLQEWHIVDADKLCCTAWSTWVTIQSLQTFRHIKWLLKSRATKPRFVWIKQHSWCRRKEPLCLRVCSDCIVTHASLPVQHNLSAHFISVANGLFGKGTSQVLMLSWRLHHLRFARQFKNPVFINKITIPSFFK